MPWLRLVQSGIQRTYTAKETAKIWLPITPAILLKLKEYWTPQKSDPNIIMAWATAVLCLFGFFRAGEITTSNISNFDSSKHLAWGDVAIDDGSSPRLLKVHLKRSKTDQLGKGIDIYIGKTDCPLCLVVAIMAYMASRGPSPGPFFKLANGFKLAVGLPESDFAGHSFRIGAATAAANAG